MFTLVGAAIGTLFAIITVANLMILNELHFLTLLVTWTLILFSFICFGAFAGMIIDILIDKIK